LDFKKSEEPDRVRVELFDKKGEAVATAIKYHREPDTIQFVSKKNLTFK
jgi:hypothetical protein